MGRLPLGATPPLQVGSDIASPQRPLCASSNNALTSPILFVSFHPKVICSDLITVFPCFYLFLCIFWLPPGACGNQFHDWDLNLWSCVGSGPHASSRISYRWDPGSVGDGLTTNSTTEFAGLGVGWGRFIFGCGGVTGLNEVAQTHRTVYPKG